MELPNTDTQKLKAESTGVADNSDGYDVFLIIRRRWDCKRGKSKKQSAAFDDGRRGYENGMMCRRMDVRKRSEQIEGDRLVIRKMKWRNLRNTFLTLCEARELVLLFAQSRWRRGKESRWNRGQSQRILLQHISLVIQQTFPALWRWQKQPRRWMRRRRWNRSLLWSRWTQLICLTSWIQQMPMKSRSKKM